MKIISNMEKIKRNRSSNWSESDKALLTELIKDKIHLVENKDVSKNNNQIKKSAWQEILQSYNAMSDTKRDLPQLLNQWRNTKNNVKKRNFEYRRNCNATGGGPRPPSPPAEDVEIMDILPNEFKIDHNIFDSDSLTNGQSAASDAKMVKNSMGIIIEQPECSSSMPPTQTVQVPIMELTGVEPKAPSKIITKRTKKRARVAGESSNSEELFILAKSGREQQIQQQKKEHEFKIKIMEEEHEMRMKILKEELEYWEKNKINKNKIL